MKRWKDCLAALVPYYSAEGGNATLICTVDGDVFEDRRTVKWNLRRLARIFSVDLEASRRNQAEYLHYRQGLPLPLSPALVLTPLKTREAVGRNDGCHSYVSLSAVTDLLEEREQGGGRSIVVLTGGHRLPCHYSLKTVRKRLRDSAIVLDRHRATLLPASEISGAANQEYREFLERLVFTLVAGVKVQGHLPWPGTGKEEPLARTAGEPIREGGGEGGGGDSP